MNENHPTKIANRFLVKSVLGEGGMGFVYKAHDPVLNKIVAIKVLRKGLPPKSIVRFQQEAKAVAKLNHPNVIDVFNFDIDEGVPYLVMEYLEGPSLSDLCKSEQWEEVTLSSVLDIFIQICEGLGHAHSNGILHRDIKPSNIMLITDEIGERQVKLVDFGLAKMGEDQSLTSTGATLHEHYNVANFSFSSFELGSGQMAVSSP